VTPLRVVVLTADAMYARRLLLKLAVAGQPTDAVVLGLRRKAARSRLARYGELLRRSYLEGRRSPRRLVTRAIRRFGAQESPGLERLTACVVDGGVFNSPEMRSRLIELAPDLLVLAGCPIVADDLLSVPTRGCLNGHPGLLPWCRGVGVVEHAIVRDVPVGATVHYVNAGIDTGDILLRTMAPYQGVEDLTTLREVAVELSLDLLVRAVGSLRSGGAVPSWSQDRKYEYCGQPTPEQEAICHRKLRDGTYRLVYQRWLAEVGGRDLPARLEEMVDVRASVGAR
jgi:methionyl-tRNA formyltransferase